MTCQRCNDWELRERDLFCPNCGWPVVPGSFSLEVRPVEGSEAGTPLVRFSPWSANPVLPALDLVARCDGELLERVPLEVFQTPIPEGLALPTLGLALLSNRKAKLSLELQHPDARCETRQVAETSSRTKRGDRPPRIRVLGALSMGAFELNDGVHVAFVTLRNDGDDIEIGDVSVSIPRLADGARARAFVRQLATGQVANVEIRLSAQQFKALTDDITLTKGAKLKLAGGGEAPLLLVRGGAPSFRLHIRDLDEGRIAFAGAGLAGRRARIGAAIENDSAETISIEQVMLKLRQDGDWNDIPVPYAWRRPLAPGEILTGELRPFLKTGFDEDGQDLPAGIVQLQLKVIARTAGDGQPERETLFAFEVRDHKPFDGRIVIDFGTTETAATMSKAKLIPSRAPTPAPVVLELTSVGLTPRQVARLGGQGTRRGSLDQVYGVSFLETSMVLTRERKWLVGHDIPSRVEGEEEDESTLPFERFKWIAEPETAPDDPLLSMDEIQDDWARGARDTQIRTDPLLLLSAFLGQVRALIEEHPDVAALCNVVEDPEVKTTRVFATSPVRMGARMETVFTKAFAAAGMPLIHGSSTHGVGRLVLESWPPLLVTAEQDEDVFASLTQDGSGIDFPRLTEAAGSARLFIFDVGGGSADLSLIEILNDDKGMRVKVLGNDMSRRFAGERFEAIIAEELRAYLNIDPGSPVGGTRDQKGALGKTARWLQNSAGPLLVFNRLDIYFNSASKDTDDVRERIRDVLPARVGELEEIVEFAPSDLLSIDDIVEITARLERRFYNDYWKYLKKKMEDLKAVSESSKESDTFVIISGRGAACPLADAMIRRLSRSVLGATQVTIGLGPPESKSITSWGATRLIDYVESEAGLVFERVDEMTKFGVGRPYRLGAGHTETTPMRPGKLWFQGRGRSRRIERTAAHGGAEADVSYAWLNAGEFPRMSEILIYSGRTDGDWQAIYEDKLKLKRGTPIDHQWVFVARNRAGWTTGVAVGAGEDAALKDLVRQLR